LPAAAAMKAASAPTPSMAQLLSALITRTPAIVISPQV
jgi:hypothetical protein